MSRLEEIRARLGAATQGKWEVYSEPDVGLPPSLFRWWRESGSPYPSREPIEPLSRHDLTFIAHCGGEDGDVAWLLGELKLAHQSAKHSSDWAQAAIDDMKKVEKERDALMKSLVTTIGAASSALGYLESGNADIARKFLVAIVDAAKNLGTKNEPT